MCGVVGCVKGEGELWMCAIERRLEKRDRGERIDEIAMGAVQWTSPRCTNIFIRVRSALR
jgi:hypothetical protein